MGKKYNIELSIEELMKLASVLQVNTDMYKKMLETGSPKFHEKAQEEIEFNDGLYQKLKKAGN